MNPETAAILIVTVTMLICTGVALLATWHAWQRSKPDAPLVCPAREQYGEINMLLARLHVRIALIADDILDETRP